MDLGQRNGSPPGDLEASCGPAGSASVQRNYANEAASWLVANLQEEQLQNVDERGRVVDGTGKVNEAFCSNTELGGLWFPSFGNIMAV